MPLVFIDVRCHHRGCRTGGSYGGVNEAAAREVAQSSGWLLERTATGWATYCPEHADTYREGDAPQDRPV